MASNNIWFLAKQVQISKTDDIIGGFDIGFDDKTPENIKAEMRKFVAWVEKNFNLPVTLWVDFEYKHYLIRRDGKRVGFLFYYADFASYPNFYDKADIPVIRLPVRTEHSTVEEILCSFIEAISCYFAWISNIPVNSYEPNENDVKEILNAYLKQEN